MSAVTEAPIPSETVASAPVVEAQPAPATAAPIAPPRRQDVILRAADLAVATTTLAVTLPVTAAVALMIRLLDGRPVLYRGVRLGAGGEPFTMYKFRTLQSGAEERLDRLYGDALQTGARVEATRVGRFLRPTQLDELPQLLNVVRGDMSIVGPRPLRPHFYAVLAEQVPNAWQRFAIRPGLTGFAQVRQNNVTPWEEKLAHDLEYIADRSLGLYARCCAQTALRVAAQTGDAVAGALRRRLER